MDQQTVTNEYKVLSVDGSNFTLINKISSSDWMTGETVYTQSDPIIIDNTSIQKTIDILTSRITTLIAQQQAITDYENSINQPA